MSRRVVPTVVDEADLGSPGGWFGPVAVVDPIDGSLAVDEASFFPSIEDAEDAHVGEPFHWRRCKVTALPVPNLEDLRDELHCVLTGWCDRVDSDEIVSDLLAELDVASRVERLAFVLHDAAQRNRYETWFPFGPVYTSGGRLVGPA